MHKNENSKKNRESSIYPDMFTVADRSGQPSNTHKRTVLYYKQATSNASARHVSVFSRKAEVYLTNSQW